MTNERTGIPHKIMCLYFQQGKTHPKALLAEALRFLDSTGLTPTVMATPFDNGFFVPFEKSLKKAQRKSFEGIDIMEIVSLPTYLQEQTQGFYATVSFINQTIHSFYFSIRDSLLNNADFDLWCANFAKLISPRYGFREVVNHSGLCANLINPEFIGNWFYEGGFVHKVHPWTLVNAHHLNRLIGEIRLEEWIAAKPRRGHVAPYSEECLLWRLPADEVDSISKELAQADILFDAQKHYYPWDWAFAGPIWDGELTRQELFRLMLQQVQKTGTVPTPPPLDPVTNMADDKLIDASLKELGFVRPSGVKRSPPRTQPVTTEEIVGGILGDLGFTSPDEVEIRKGDNQPISEDEKKRIFKKKPKK